MKIKMITDFTETPGGRFVSETPFSGEEFRDRLLKPSYDNAKQNNEILYIDLDGGFGYPTSFLEESFGGLARIYPNDNIMELITIKSEDEPELIDDIIKYVVEANTDKYRRCK